MPTRSEIKNKTPLDVGEEVGTRSPTLALVIALLVNAM